MKGGRFKLVELRVWLVLVGFLLSVLRPSSAVPLPPITELQALWAFANADGNMTIGGNLRTWNGGFDAQGNWTGRSPCQGYLGVRCWSSGRLRLLRIPGIGLSGILSPALGNLTGLTRLSLGENTLSGDIPPELGQLVIMKKLRLGSNLLTGSVPDWIKNMTALEELSLGSNFLQGRIPLGVYTNLSSLVLLDFSNNSLSGIIPDELFTNPSLQTLLLNSNNFTGSIPTSLANATFFSLSTVDFSENSLEGPLPQSWTIPNLTSLDLSGNNLFGVIPPQLLNLATLTTLNLARNNFVGNISQSVSNKFGCEGFLGNPGLVMEDPKCMIRNVNAPPSPGLGSSQGPETNPGPPEVQGPGNKSKGLSTLAIVALTAGDIALLLISAVGFTLFWLWWKKKKEADIVKAAGANGEESKLSSSSTIPSKSDSKELSSAGNGLSSGAKSSFVATPALRPALKSVVGVMPDPANDKEYMAADMSIDQSLSCDDFGADLVILDTTLLLEFEDLLRANAMVLGSGTFGGVYMAVLEDGQMLAIKRLEEQPLMNEHAFGKQCSHLAEVMHPNLLQMRAYCWSPQEKLLIFDYMSNGSVFSLLHGEKANQDKGADWSTRLKIAVGTARALAHLHDNDMIHGNLKATNVLLDEHFEPRVSDFGLEALLQTPQKHTTQAGYLAPELGITTRHRSQDGDVYSFGVLLLELLTGLEPMGKNNMDLPTWVQEMASSSRTVEIFDPALVSMHVLPAQDVLEFLELALACVSEDARARPSITIVLRSLEAIVPGSAGPRHVQDEHDEDSDDNPFSSGFNSSAKATSNGSAESRIASPISSVGSFYSNVSSANNSPSR